MRHGYMAGLRLSKCEASRSEDVDLEAPDGPGLYRVYIYAGLHAPWPGSAVQVSKIQTYARGAVHGCTIENVRLAKVG